MSKTLSTDYLVVGAGAAGMAFVDALIAADPKAEVILVDRRHAPGGHWLEAYPFVRLHQPSRYYGCNSLPLGSETIDTHGPNAGFYAQAGAAEICAYYERVMNEVLLPSGRVRFFPMSRYEPGGSHRIVSALSGEAFEVTVRRKLVNASYLQNAVPSSTPPPFEVDGGVRCIPVGALTRAQDAGHYTVVGAGKTAMDACVWLLDQGVDPERIRWVKPREAWLQNRPYLQCGERVSDLVEGLGQQLEAALEATSVDDLFARLEGRDQFLRVDRSVTPTMYRGPTLSEREVTALRRITDVVRLGHVRRIGREALELAQGRVTTKPDSLYVHCATRGLNAAPEVPMFSEGRITLQSIRLGLQPFAAALTGYVEATREDGDLETKNRLCPPMRQPNTPMDWVRGTLNGMKADHRWSREPDLADWLERARLNPASGLRARLASDPKLQQALGRFAKAARPGVAALRTLAP